MRFAWVLFVLSSSGAGVGWVDHPAAVVAARGHCNDRQAQEGQQRCRRDMAVVGVLGCRLLLRLKGLLLVQLGASQGATHAACSRWARAAGHRYYTKFLKYTCTIYSNM